MEEEGFTGVLLTLFHFLVFSHLFTESSACLHVSFSGYIWAVGEPPWAHNTNSWKLLSTLEAAPKPVSIDSKDLVQKFGGVLSCVFPRRCFARAHGTPVGPYG